MLQGEGLKHFMKGKINFACCLMWLGKDKVLFIWTLSFRTPFALCGNMFIFLYICGHSSLTHSNTCHIFVCLRVLYVAIQYIFWSTDTQSLWKLLFCFLRRFLVRFLGGFLFTCTVAFPPVDLCSYRLLCRMCVASLSCYFGGSVSTCLSPSWP